MVELSPKHAPGRLCRAMSDDEESDGEFSPHHSPDAQSSQAGERQEMSLVRYQDILPVVRTLGTRFIICQYITLAMTMMLCVYMSLIIFAVPQWLPARPGFHDNVPSTTRPEPSREQTPQAAGDMRRGTMREVPAVKVTGSPAGLSSTLSKGNNVQRPRRSTDAPERHDSINKQRGRRKAQRRVRSEPTASAPSSSQSSQTVPFPGATIHKDSQGRVDYWLVRGKDGQFTRMVPVDVTPLGVVFHESENGQTYLVTFEGEWIKFRPN